MLTSTVMAFNIALAKTMSEYDPSFKEALRENFKAIRKNVSNNSKMTDSHKAIFEILGIEDDTPPARPSGTKVIDHREGGASS